MEDTGAGEGETLVLDASRPARSPAKGQRGKGQPSVEGCKCPFCGESFASRSLLTQHRKDHHGKRPFSCPDCKKCFLSRSHFVEHQRVHTGERPYRCHECSLGFTTAHNLKRHRAIHARQRGRLKHRGKVAASKATPSVRKEPQASFEACQVKEIHYGTDRIIKGVLRRRIAYEIEVVL
ncbi:zinc finger protein 22 [Amia ocellicauda]|uniref:zinc finger protein 22 n=1 Tax=Amia ocellicauda TaxID=2972642 RepID=UPI003464013D